MKKKKAAKLPACMEVTKLRPPVQYDVSGWLHDGQSFIFRLNATNKKMAEAKAIMFVGYNFVDDIEFTSIKKVVIDDDK